MLCVLALAAAIGCASGAGCAHFAGDVSVCPEYRDVRCLTVPECSMDEERGCRVCQCSPAGSPPPIGHDPLPTDRNQQY